MRSGIGRALDEGENALDPIPNAGGKSRLNDVQRVKLGVLLRLGARTNGFATELWTLRRVRDVIEREFGVRYSISNVHIVLHTSGSARRRLCDARVSKTPPRSNVFAERTGRASKKAEQEGRAIALSDESGFMLQPPAPRTWAPVGRTPELICGARHDHVSAISAITISPSAQRMAWEHAQEELDKAERDLAAPV